MSEKPILFNTEMVKAILEGRKTQTRRITKPQPDYDMRLMGALVDTTCKATSRYIGYASFQNKANSKSAYANIPCKTGDLLYVRETWCDIWDKDGWWIGYGYKADGEPDTDHWGVFKDGPIKGFRWRPSIHMPKEAARIWLQVTNIRVERLQDITNEGAKAEGVDGAGSAPHVGLSDWQVEYDFSVEKFLCLWDKTIKSKDRVKYGWDANPWVWVYEFERVDWYRR